MGGITASSLTPSASFFEKLEKRDRKRGAERERERERDQKRKRETKVEKTIFEMPWNSMFQTKYSINFTSSLV